MKISLRYLKFVTLCFIILFSSCIPTTIGQQDNGDRPWWYRGGPYNPELEDIPGGNILNFLGNQIFPLLGWYNIGSGIAPKYFFADPDIIEIDYLENVTIDLVWGTQRTERRNWHRFQAPVFPEFTIQYEAIFPDNISKNAFKVTFDPPKFDVKDYDDYWKKEIDEGRISETDVPQATTKLNLSLDRPADPNNPIQDFILKIDVYIYRKYGNLIGIFGIGAFLGGFWRVNYNADVGHKSFNIFVKVKPFRNAEIYVPPPVEMHLDDLRSAEIKVENRGSNIEQLGFRSSGEGDSLIVNVPGPITIYPGEIRSVDIGLITKPIIYDRGTLHSIEVEVYPHDNPDVTLARGILSVRTQGVSIQGIFSYEYSLHIFIIILVILILITLLIFIRRFNLTKICQKPQKPWTIPKEKEYLEKLLKDKKREKYQESLQMMKDEYQSALLWYYYYRKYLITKNRKKINWKKINDKFSSISSHISKRIKRKEVEKPEIKEEKLIELKRPIERKVDVKRERTLRKIKKQEEKQNKRLRIRSIS